MNSSSKNAEIELQTASLNLLKSLLNPHILKSNQNFTESFSNHTKIKSQIFTEIKPQYQNRTSFLLPESFPQIFPFLKTHGNLSLNLRFFLFYFYFLFYCYMIWVLWGVTVNSLRFLNPKSKLL